jgi:hypothetical protein
MGQNPSKVLNVVYSSVIPTMQDISENVHEELLSQPQSV